MQWTDAAQAEWERWSQRVRSRMVGSGADADEVVEDLRAHVDAEIGRRNLRSVQAGDLLEILRAVGEPEIPSSEVDVGVGGDTGLGRMTHAPIRREWITLEKCVVFFIGILLPLIALGLESVTHMCAAVFFDPIPTPWHMLIVAYVPIVNGILFYRLKRPELRGLGWLNVLSGLAVGISLIYTLMFIGPMIPGVIAVIYFGMGLLPWAPCLAMIATLKLRSRVAGLSTKADRAIHRQGFIIGCLVGFFAVLIPDLPSAITRVALRSAASEKLASQQWGIRVLRTYAHEETLLRYCYDQPRGFLEFLAMLDGEGPTMSQEQARDVYFRVTGKPFNSVPPPELYTRAGRWSLAEDTFTWDNDTGLGGESVAGRVKGLTMTASRLDGWVESDAGVAYCEWIMEFRNNAGTAREGRAQIALPTGGVVSRLTLWIDGEEREAAFAGRGQVRAAYQEVAVRQRRDPVLVTTSGPNQVLMQCFPVPPNGGTMKLRVGITAPLRMLDEAKGVFSWPHFTERNFNLAPRMRHSIWMQSDAALTTSAADLKIVKRGESSGGLQGVLSDEDLLNPINHLKIERSSPEIQKVRSPAKRGGWITQEMSYVTLPAPEHIVVVLDASASMSESLELIARGIESMQGQTAMQILLATDRESDRWREIKGVGEALDARVLDRIRAANVEGGQDNVPALQEAWDRVAQRGGGVVLWIHGPVPVLLDSVEGLRQRMERRRSGVRVISMQTRPGPNRVFENLVGHEVESAWRGGTIESDLKSLTSEWSGDAQVANLKRVLLGDDVDFDCREVSDHVARLWAFEEIQRRISARQTQPAVALAAEYQLVTPVSGAVVLETQAQYDRAGLTPAEVETVPMVPEPGTWALLGMGGAILVLFARARRKGKP